MIARMVLVTALMAVPEALAGQACLGTTPTGSVVVGGGVARETGDATRVAVESVLSLTDRRVARVHYDRTRFGDPVTPDRHRAGLGISLPELTPAPLCLTLSATYTRLGDLTVLYAPLGVALGVDLPLPGDGLVLRSQVEPRLGWRHATLRGFGRTSIAGSVVGGSGVAWGRVYGGIAVEWMPAERWHWATGVRLAIGL